MESNSRSDQCGSVSPARITPDNGEDWTPCNCRCQGNAGHDGDHWGRTYGTVMLWT